MRRSANHRLTTLELMAGIALAIGAQGCGATDKLLPDGGAATTGSGGGQSLVILTKDFDNYMAWTRFDLGTADSDGVHSAGDRVAYLNKAPPSGSTAFPVGTILVKTIGSGTDAGHTFAMAKVGGDYNEQGAAGWEWFELQAAPTGGPQIVWAGTQAPANESYLASTPNSCNTCHASASGNDFVPSPQLSLSSF